MSPGLHLINPKIQPPLDEQFRPAVLANRNFQAQLEKKGTELVIGLERHDGRLSRFETSAYPEDHPKADENFAYVERLVKFLLWQRGGFRIYIGGPGSIGNYIRQCYSPRGPRRFDYYFMGEQVYERMFEVVPCQPDQVPAAYETGKPLGRNLNGYRIGSDLGASDRKVCAVVDGEVVYSEEVIWEPRNRSDPEYHYQEILAALKAAASKMPRVDAIGGSSAGIYIDNRPMVA